MRRDERVIDRDRTDGDDNFVTERVGASPGIIRALFTLAGVAAAGLLVWIASTFDWTEQNGDFWIAMALLAGSGLALGLSQLFGGWTKWGWPTLSPMMFLFAFLPTLIVGGWVLLAKQPQSGVEEGRFDRWSGDLGISGLVNDLNEFLPVIPLIIGLVFAFTFDTTGPRTRVLRRDADVPDEDVHDYRRTETTTAEPVGARTTTSDRSVSDELGDRESTSTVGTGTTRETTSDRSVSDELGDRESTSTVGTGTTREENGEVRESDRRDTV
ncbi:MAG: hypothetical protein M3377_05865 [Actinomycetota bacterium]|nr:hypothetical protein [Actinomycetota bacterium]